MISTAQPMSGDNGRPRWQVGRCRFNHDWLKNQYLQALGRWDRLLGDEIDDPGFERRFVAEVLPMWKEQERLIAAIVGEFEVEMSPRALFAQYPLSNCDSGTQNWLPDLVHALWLVRHPVRQWIGNARGSIEAARSAYTALSEQLCTCRNTRSIEAIRPFRPDFERFRHACHDLATAIEEFPDRILVV